MAFDITSSNRVLKDRRDVLKALKPSEHSIKLKQGIRNFPLWLFLQEKVLIFLFFFGLSWCGTLHRGMNTSPFRH